MACRGTLRPTVPAVLTPPLAPAAGEREARRALRDQIARLERELGCMLARAYPRLQAPPAGARHAGPRLLGLGELERIRDDLVDRVARVQAATAAQQAAQAEARALRAAMLRAPERHRWVRITQADVGEPGCGAWQSRPQLGLLGMLMGWWRVKLSSGCPLAD
jgi:hypothetical protein